MDGSQFSNPRLAELLPAEPGGPVWDRQQCCEQVVLMTARDEEITVSSLAKASWRGRWGRNDVEFISDAQRKWEERAVRAVLLALRDNTQERIDWDDKSFSNLYAVRDYLDAILSERTEGEN